MKTTVRELLDTAASPNVHEASLAMRELVKRDGECKDHVRELIGLLSHSHAIRSYASEIIFRIGDVAVPMLVAAFEESSGSLRETLIGLISSIANYETFFPLLRNEMRTGDASSRQWAANCLARCYADAPVWPVEDAGAVNEAIELLRSAKGTKYASQAGITLRQLGLL